ncbi:RNA polymerase sigma factor RpoE [Halorhodospira halochloris]|uniref:RNA polymerase sigma factor RpoE n=1 Tax=Halorhodospira halochloris TaxID=1052 RepID=A0A120MZZ8_HALHR|nr:RNA polymerase sigma factor RpoE [Halorhodospira halochloris]BAU58317.1 RNA polymerase sigma factor RpoE [Halorhodospira halochloris]
MTISREADRELVKRAQAGDKQAYDVLVLRYQQKLVKLIGRYVRDPQEAQDVGQEAFIKAYRALDSFRGDSSFYTWLYRIGVNTAKNHLVAQNRRPPDSDVDAEDAERFDIDTVLRDQDTPEAEVAREEIERAVVGAIEALPEELQTAITLRELEGLSYQEISQVMDCPVGTVRSRIFRAREAIDKRLRPLAEQR